MPSSVQEKPVQTSGGVGEGAVDAIPNRVCGDKVIDQRVYATCLLPAGHDGPCADATPNRASSICGHRNGTFTCVRLGGHDGKHQAWTEVVWDA